MTIDPKTKTMINDYAEKAAQADADEARRIGDRPLAECDSAPGPDWRHALSEELGHDSTDVEWEAFQEAYAKEWASEVRAA